MWHHHCRFQGEGIKHTSFWKKGLLLAKPITHLSAMKKLIHLSLLALAISSCSTDSLSPDNQPAIAKSEIAITVTRYQYDGICPDGCYGDTGQPIFFVSNATIGVKAGIVQDTLAFSLPAYSGVTDKSGTVILTDVEPGQYTVKVETQFGNKYRTLHTQLHKRAFIDFSF